MIRLRWGSFVILAVLAGSLVNCSSSNSTGPNPTPVITSIFPDSITAGSAMFNIDLTGQGFLNKPASVALWNGSPRTTTFNASTGHLTITVLAADVTNPAVALISVTNPPPGGGTSAGASFKINALQSGAPMNISLSPSSANAGTKGPFTLTVNGTNFVAGSIIRWDGTFRQPTSVSPTAVTTDLTTADLALPGFASVSVDNPLPGGIVASSVSVDFIINSSKGANTSAGQVISVNSFGGPADGGSSAPAISSDGRFVAFYSTAKNLVSGGSLGNVFVRDMCVGASNCTPRSVAVDLSPDGSAPNAPSSDQIAMSGDGRFVAFASYATNLSAGSSVSANAASAPEEKASKPNLFLRDMCTGTNAPAGCTPHTELLSRNVPDENASGSPVSLSTDGRYVAYVSDSPSVLSGQLSSQSQVYVHDTCAGPTATVACVLRTIPVTVDMTSSAEGLQASQSKISGTGRYVVFQALTADASTTTARSSSQIYLRDMCLGADSPAGCVPSTLRVSVAPDGTKLGGLNTISMISADARFVLFESHGGGEVPDGIAAPAIIFLRDTCLGSTAPDGCVPSTTLVYSQQTSTKGSSGSLEPSMSQSGRFISFVVHGNETSQGSTERGSVFIHDTCFGVIHACTRATYPLIGTTADTNSQPLALDRIAPVPLTADGRYAVYYSCGTVDPAAPISGLGDVFFTATPFR